MQFCEMAVLKQARVSPRSFRRKIKEKKRLRICVCARRKVFRGASHVIAECVARGAEQSTAHFNTSFAVGTLSCLYAINGMDGRRKGGERGCDNKGRVSSNKRANFFRQGPPLLLSCGAYNHQL